MGRHRARVVSKKARFAAECRCGWHAKERSEKGDAFHDAYMHTSRVDSRVHGDSSTILNEPHATANHGVDSTPAANEGPGASIIDTADNANLSRPARDVRQRRLVFFLIALLLLSAGYVLWFGYYQHPTSQRSEYAEGVHITVALNGRRHFLSRGAFTPEILVAHSGHINLRNVTAHLPNGDVLVLVPQDGITQEAQPRWMGGGGGFFSETSAAFSLEERLKTNAMVTLQGEAEYFDNGKSTIVKFSEVMKPSFGLWPFFDPKKRAQKQHKERMRKAMEELRRKGYFPE